MIMKKWLSHFAYNQRSRSGWTLSTHLKNTSKSNLIGQKTVTYVPGTFVTLVPGPNTCWVRAELTRRTRPGSKRRPRQVSCVVRPPTSAGEVRRVPRQGQGRSGASASEVRGDPVEPRIFDERR